MTKNGIDYVKSPERRFLLDIPFALGVSAGAAVLSPALIPAAMLASRSWRPLYHDTRRTPGGSLLEVYKLQTMPPKAESETREVTGRYHPEAGKVGNSLRHIGLDELPQVAHILAGQMSAVGPRPLLPETDEYMQKIGGGLYTEWLAAVAEGDIRPGQFGPSQLYRRGHHSDVGSHALRTSLAIDLEYYGERATLASDWQLITRSIAGLTHLSSMPPEEIVKQFVGPEPFETV